MLFTLFNSKLFGFNSPKSAIELHDSKECVSNFKSDIFIRGKDRSPGILEAASELFNEPPG